MNVTEVVLLLIFLDRPRPDAATHALNPFPFVVEPITLTPLKQKDPILIPYTYHKNNNFVKFIYGKENFYQLTLV